MVANSSIERGFIKKLGEDIANDDIQIRQKRTALAYPLKLEKNPCNSPLIETENAVVLMHFTVQVTNKSGMFIARRTVSMNDHFTVSKAFDISSLMAERDETRGL